VLGAMPWGQPCATQSSARLAGYLVPWTIYWLFKLIRGKEGMGLWRLQAAGRLLGAWLGLADVAPDRAPVVGRWCRDWPCR